jgi:4-coumarate--CoA ligase
VSCAEFEAYLNWHSHVIETGWGPGFDETQLRILPTANVVLKEHLVDKRAVKQALVEVQADKDAKVSEYKELRGGVWEVTRLPRTQLEKYFGKS